MKTLQYPQITPASFPIFPNLEQDLKKYLYKMPRISIEVIFFGSDPWSLYVLNALEDNFDVRAVVTAPDSVVAQYFKGLVLDLNELDDNFTADLMVVASYGKIIPKSILALAKFGALNVHPSLLPKYRGSSPVPATILNGDKKTGVTIIKIDEKMDHGPVVATREVSLTGQEDFIFLINKLFQLGAKLLVEVINNFIAGQIKLQPQNHSLATYCPLLTRESGFFEIDRPPENLDSMIRAYHPWPGVWTRWSPSAKASGDKKGKIVKFYPEGRLQMEGKKILSFKDFQNGYPDFPLKSITLDKK